VGKFVVKHMLKDQPEALPNVGLQLSNLLRPFDH
jgi:hypothetical protein